MARVTSIFIFALGLGWIGMPLVAIAQNKVPLPLTVGDLEPKLDDQEVTIKFTIAKLDGISQLTKEGQAPSFAIEADSGKDKNLLDVWIEGELANVLDRLQMSAFQENALKVGTTIIATGKLSKHKSIPNQYFLSVTKWQGFRILPSKPEK